MKKPKLLLLDSDVVIHCHELAVWEEVKDMYTVFVGSIVAEEAKFAKTPDGNRPIDLNSEATQGKISIVEATASDMSEVINQFVDSFAKGLDDGETEGIAIMVKGELDECKFSCGDTNGQEAVGMLSLGHKFISLEEILALGGIRVSPPLKLKPHFLKRSADLHVQKGAARRVTNECFKKPPLDL
jgi:hypothetical protein